MFTTSKMHKMKDGEIILKNVGKFKIKQVKNGFKKAMIYKGCSHGI